MARRVAPLPWFDERRVGPETTTDQLVTMILEDLGHRIAD